MTNTERREKLAEIFGQLWTTGNPLKILVSRKDITVLEVYTMYVMLCDLLDLGEE